MLILHTAWFNIPKFEKHYLNPDPGYKQQNNHLRKSVAKPRGKTKSWTGGIQAERRREGNNVNVTKTAS